MRLSWRLAASFEVPAAGSLRKKGSSSFAVVGLLVDAETLLLVLGKGIEVLTEGAGGVKVRKLCAVGLLFGGCEP